VVFVVEDNAWAISVPRSASTAIASNADRAAAYGIPGHRVEDNDVEAVYAVAGEAVARARSGRGPSLIEVQTLRMWGHFEGDAQGYRPELAEVASHDPIPRYEQRLRADGVLDDAQVAMIRELATATVEEAVAFAKDSPTPDPTSATDHVFA
jgi:pyruvate dehydrogenase E1 component alpha subunit